MPAIDDLFDAKGRGNRIPALMAPLQGQSNKKLLSMPMGAGAYALASIDRKTVLKVLVLPKEQAGFDPALSVPSLIAQGLDDAIINRVKSTWMVIQMTFESFDPGVHPAIQLMLASVQSLGKATDGVVADPISQVYKLPENSFTTPLDGWLTDVRDLVSIKSRPLKDGLHIYTLGMQKFSLPELEITRVDPSAAELAAKFCLGFIQNILRGEQPVLGASVGVGNEKLKISHGGLDRDLWQGLPVYELIPEGSESVNTILRRWASDVNIS